MKKLYGSLTLFAIFMMSHLTATDITSIDIQQKSPQKLKDKINPHILTKKGMAGGAASALLFTGLLTHKIKNPEASCLPFALTLPAGYVTLKTMYDVITKKGSEQEQLKNKIFLQSHAAGVFSIFFLNSLYNHWAIHRHSIFKDITRNELTILHLYIAYFSVLYAWVAWNGPKLAAKNEDKLNELEKAAKEAAETEMAAAIAQEKLLADLEALKTESVL